MGFLFGGGGPSAKDLQKQSLQEQANADVQFVNSQKAQQAQVDQQQAAYQQQTNAILQQQQKAQEQQAANAMSSSGAFFGVGSPTGSYLNQSGVTRGNLLS